MSETVDIPMPLRGVSELAAYAAQPEGTCREARNVRPFDTFAERLRIAKRPGLSRYNAAQVNGSNPVSDLIAVSFPNAGAITHQNAFPPVVDWSASITPNFNIATATWGPGGAIYAVTYEYKVMKLLTGGAVEWSRAIVAPTDGAWPVAIRPSASGEFLYVAFGQRAYATPKQGRVYKYRIGATALELVWEWTLDPTVNVFAMDVDETSIWVVGATASNTVGAGWRLYDNGSSAVTVAMTQAMGGLPRSIVAWEGGTAIVGVHTPVAAPTDTIVKKITADGAVVWTTTLTGRVSGVARGPATTVYAAGYIQASGLREATKFSETAYAAVAVDWTYASARGSPSVTYLEQVAVDRDGNAYFTELSGGGANWHVRRVSNAGVSEWAVDVSNADALLVDRDRPHTAQSVEGIYVLKRAPIRLKQSAPAPADVSNRTITLLAVSNGDIRVVPPGAGTITVPTGGSGALGTSLRWTRSVVFQGRVYFTDGARSVYYDPSAGTVTPWRATTAGTLPPQSRILEVWRGRVCMAGNPDDPHNWHMSAVLDAHDWDYVPYNPTPADAVVGNNAPMGECPDMVNAIVPLTNDIALFGGDRSIYRMTGDPLLGGVFELVSTQIGMTFGRGWCLDSAGVLYFFGSRGGVYRLAPGGLPESITDAVMKRTLDAVDLAATRVRLVWNDRDRGLHVFLSPWAAAATTHYFWHAPTASWWPDAFGDTGLDPLNVVLLDGDAPGDRSLLLGTRGGYVRKWDHAAKGDDGTAIDAYAVLGPVAAATDREIGMRRLEVTLSAASNPVAYSVFGTNTPEALGAAKFSGSFAVAGRNTTRARARGRQLFVRLANATLDQSFSVDSASAEVEVLGGVR